MAPKEFDIPTEHLVAYLFARQKVKNQSTIAKLLEMSSANVGLLLAKARKQGLIVEKIDVSLSESLQKNEHHLAERVASLQENEPLRVRLNRFNCLKYQTQIPLRKVSIFPIDVLEKKTDGSFDNIVWDLSVYEFGSLIAESVWKALATSRKIGVSWGRLLYSTVHGIKPLDKKVRDKNHDRNAVSVIPLWGEPLDSIDKEITSRVFPETERLSCSNIAMELSRILFGDGIFARSLAGIPAVIPIAFDDIKIDAMKCYAEESRDYVEIFGKRPERDSDRRQVDEVDTMLLPVGSSLHENRFLRPSVIRMLVDNDATANLKMSENEDKYEKEKEDHLIRQKYLSEFVLGDIGSVILAQPGIKPKQVVKFDKYIEHWLGVKKQHIVACASRAHEDDQKPGVIVIAAGELRAKTVLEAIRLGMITQLYIDRVLARELNRLLDELERKK